MKAELQAPKHIGILRLSALGDVTLMVPMVRAIQRAYPHATITWITSKLAYSLLKGLGGVEFVVIDKPASIGDYWRLYQRFNTYQFDVLLAPQASLRANLIYPLIKANLKIGFDKARARDAHSWFINKSIKARKEHLLDGFMQFAEAIGVKDCTVDWQMPIDDTDWQWARARITSDEKPWLAINAAASKSERSWLVNRYAAVIDAAASRWSVNVVLMGGPSAAESEIAKAIQKNTSVDCLNLVGKTSIKKMAAVLGSVDVLLSPDTGPLHIAGAMGTSVVGLYAVAPPELSGPYLSQHLVINKYPEAVRQILKKDPETVRWQTRVHDPRAMALIEVDEVLEKLTLVLEKE